MTPAYLEKAWGDSVDNPSIQDVRNAILETTKMDDEHGAFWVASDDDESVVLETHKDLSVIGIFPHSPGHQFKSQFRNWHEVEELYRVFFSGDFERVKAMLLANS